MLRGALNYRDVAGQSALRNAKLSGDIGSNGLAVSSPQAALKIQKIAGKYQLADGNFRADAIALDLFNGTLTASGTVEQVDTARRSRFHVQLAGISLQALKSSMRNPSKQSLPVTGTLNATADANWVGTPAKLQAKSALTVRGALVGSNGWQSQSFPLNADMHVSYDAPRNLLSVASSSIQLPATAIHAVVCVPAAMHEGQIEAQRQDENRRAGPATANPRLLQIAQPMVAEPPEQYVDAGHCQGRHLVDR